MGEFLTSKSRLRQTNIEGIWYTEDNQLYKDDDGQIYLAPRCTLTDGFTIPEIFTSIVGGKFKHDVRCSIQHDWENYYHSALKVELTVFELKKQRYLHYKDDMWVCEDIPWEHLRLDNTTFRETNERFMRMLSTLTNISKFDTWLIGNAVNLNIGWLKSPKPFNKDRLYRIDYNQVR